MNKKECIEKVAFELLKHYSKISLNYIPDEFNDETQDKDDVTINFVLNIIVAFNKFILESLVEHYNIVGCLVEIIDRMNLSLKEEFGLND